MSKAIPSLRSGTCCSTCKYGIDCSEDDEERVFCYLHDKERVDSEQVCDKFEECTLACPCVTCKKEYLKQGDLRCIGKT